jgi:hypothetical protein
MPQQQLSSMVRQRLNELMEDLCVDLEIPCNTNFPFKDERAAQIYKALVAAATYADEQARTPKRK